MTQRGAKFWRPLFAVCCSVLQCVAVCCSMSSATLFAHSYKYIHVSVQFYKHIHTYIHVYMYTRTCIYKLLECVPLSVHAHVCNFVKVHKYLDTYMKCTCFCVHTFTMCVHKFRYAPFWQNWRHCLDIFLFLPQNRRLWRHLDTRVLRKSKTCACTLRDTHSMCI